MIYVCEHHDHVLAHWRESDRREIALAHVDFHDDLRGLLVNRRREIAHPIGELARGVPPVDPGNFLAHAVLEGRLRQVRWIHDRVGGRAWDAGIVRYESDLLATRFRLRHWLSRGREFPLEFEEVLLDDWNGLEPGDLLSVDWDCFASTVLDVEGIEERAGRFLGRLGEVVPGDTYLAYSPEYCHPTLEAFRGFVDRLESRFAQPVTWLGESLADGRLGPARTCAELPRGPLMRLVLYLRRKGIY